MIRRDGLPHFDYVSRWALFSDCEQYRYELGRVWDESLPLIVWILLNPSTADEDNSDATNTRCEHRSKALGAGGQVFVNLFALRSVTPDALYTHADPVGPDNDDVILENAHRADRVIAGWGTHGKLNERGEKVSSLIYSAGLRLEHLAMTKDGLPRHPLYLPYSTAPMPMCR